MKLQPIFLFFSERKLLKLQQHIDAHFESENKNDMPSYDTVSQMEYLDMFVRETFRMYPIAPLIINRQSTEEFHIKNIGTIPAGTRIAIDMYNLHFDPNLWGPADPHIFYPERFETKRHTMALVRLLKTYSLVNRSDKTYKFFEQLETGFVITPKEVIIRLQRSDEYHD